MDDNYCTLVMIIVVHLLPNESLKNQVKDEYGNETTVGWLYVRKTVYFVVKDIVDYCTDWTPPWVFCTFAAIFFATTSFTKLHGSENIDIEHNISSFFNNGFLIPNNINNISL